MIQQVILAQGRPSAESEVRCQRVAGMFGVGEESWRKSIVAVVPAATGTRREAS